MTSEVARSDRGGFWRRAIALIIDAFVVAVVVMLLGLLAGALTNGRVRISDVYFDETECAKPDRTYGEIELPEGFKPTTTVQCVSKIFGYAYDRALVIVERTESGKFSFERSLTFPLDGEGNVANAFYVDWIFPFFLVIAIYLQESMRGDTLGKRIMGLRMRSLGGASPDRSQIAKRLVRFAYLVPFVATYLAVAYFNQSVGTASYLLALLALGSALTLAAVIEFGWAVSRDKLPFYDRWAGTEVVRVRDDPEPA
jgi:uncharacterized RDD family membrane protein YckC